MIFVVGAAAFILVGWSVIAKFNECRAGRAEWSEAAVTAGIGAAILVFTTFLLTQADAVFA
jgi:integrating conjugative element membrane protein (TIGR03745 family)